MGVRVGAAAILPGWMMRMVVTHVGDGADVVGVIMHRYMIHLLVNQGVRVVKLRGMQDRHLAAAEHGHGDQRRDHDMFDDLLHGAKQTRLLLLRQAYAGFGEMLAIVIF